MTDSAMPGPGRAIDVRAGRFKLSHHSSNFESAPAEKSAAGPVPLMSRASFLRPGDLPAAIMKILTSSMRAARVLSGARTMSTQRSLLKPWAESVSLRSLRHREMVASQSLRSYSRLR